MSVAAVQYASLCCVAAGLIAGAVTLFSTGDPRLGVRVALDLWLAAGLLLLAVARTWEHLLSVAVIIGVRHLAVGRALSGGAGRAAPWPATSGPGRSRRPARPGSPG